MMLVETFRRTLSEAAPPGGMDLALQALWWAGKGDWDRGRGSKPGRTQSWVGVAGTDDGTLMLSAVVQV